MKFEHVNSYPATSARVFEMLRDKAFRERVCEAIHTLSHEVTITEEGDTTAISVEQTRATSGIPSFAKKFVGDTVVILQRETWSGLDRATFDMEIPGKPGALHGAIELRESNGTCDQVFTGSLTVKVPFIGGRLESFVAGLLRKALTYEGRTGVAWLEERAG